MYLMVIDGKRIHVGYYTDEVEAAKAYDQVSMRKT